jgi:hypothetical protein
MTIKPKWDSKSAGEYERSLTLRDIKVEDDDDIQDYKKPWVGLTDEQFQTIRNSLSLQEGWDGDGWDLALKEAIEAKLKELNT